jgi:hypothetical protein
MLLSRPVCLAERILHMQEDTFTAETMFLIQSLSFTIPIREMANQNIWIPISGDRSTVRA